MSSETPVYWSTQDVQLARDAPALELMLRRPLDQLTAATALRLQIADLPADTYASCGLGS
jgi:hypothetical protein